MSNSRSTLHLRPHLKVLYQFSQLLHITEFNFNESTRRLEYCRSRAQVSRIIFKILAFICGANLVLASFLILIWYLNFIKLSKYWRSITAQVDTLRCACILSEYLSTYMFAMNFLRLGHTLMPVANEMFEIFDLIKVKSDSRMCFPVSFRAALVIKVLVCLSRILSDLCENFVYTWSLSIVFPCGRIVAIMVFCGHMYSQLVLICFYHKMNDLLKVASGHLTQRELTRNIRDLLRISFRIHQVKRSLNTFFSPLFLSTYLGLFMDISRFYDILRCVMYCPFSKDLMQRLLHYTARLIWSLPSMLTVSYNIYLIGRLSDLLAHTETMFEQRILLLFCRNKLKATRSVKWEIDQLMVRSKIYECNYRACGIFQMDAQFSLHFITNIIFVNVLNCLQFYISQAGSVPNSYV